MILCYDGIGADARAIRQVAKPGDAVFHYADGAYAWTPPDLRLFAGEPVDLVAITVEGDRYCAVADVETGDLSPAAAPGYIRGRRALGHQAAIYCDLSTLPAVRRSCAGLTYNVIVADWTGEPHQVDGTIGTQYCRGPDFDLTVIYDPSWRKRL